MKRNVTVPEGRSRRTAASCAWARARATRHREGVHASYPTQDTSRPLRAAHLVHRLSRQAPVPRPIVGQPRRRAGMTASELGSHFCLEPRLICVLWQRGRGFVTLPPPWVWIGRTSEPARRHDTTVRIPDPARHPPAIRGPMGGTIKCRGHQGRRTSVVRQTTTIESWLTKSEPGSSPVARAERGTKAKVSGPSCATGSRVSSGSIAGCERRSWRLGLADDVSTPSDATSRHRKLRETHLEAGRRRQSRDW